MNSLRSDTRLKCARSVDRSWKIVELREGRRRFLRQKKVKPLVDSRSLVDPRVTFMTGKRS